MKLAILGFGGMGKAAYEAATKRGHEVMVIVDPRADEATATELSGEILKEAGVEVVIDVSLGEAVLENAQICNEAGANLVIGATGWYDQMDEMKEATGDIGCLWSSNFSIGVNMYFKIVEEAAKLINRFDEYDVWGHEIHHFQKADSPSGTAKTLGEILLKNIDRKSKIVDSKLDRRREGDEIHFSSLRGGEVNFKHEIGFDSAADTIVISHSARNRGGYALGAIKCAEWIKGKKGFFQMEDFLSFSKM